MYSALLSVLRDALKQALLRMRVVSKMFSLAKNNNALILRRLRNSRLEGRKTKMRFSFPKIPALQQRTPPAFPHVTSAPHPQRF